MSFQTILSEARMDKVIKAITLEEEVDKDEGRPDITMIFSDDPESVSCVDVVVVEIKKKDPNEKDSLYAVNQLLDRASKLVIHCPNIERMWYYAVIEVDQEIEKRLKQMKWTPLFSMGKVFYNEYQSFRSDETPVPTPVFIVSFDAIVGDAESRNHTFLEILRDGMKKYTSETA